MTHIHTEQGKDMASQRRGSRLARLRLAIQVGAMGLLSGACYAGSAEETEDALLDDNEFEAADKLFVGGKLWTEAEIRYCFLSGSAALMDDFQSALNSSWGALGIIRFKRVSSCDNNDAKMVKVSYNYGYEDSAKAKVGMGSVMSSRSDVDVQMARNLSGASSTNRYLVRHEMGHILGFAHEHYRIEGQRDCPGDWDAAKYDEYKNGVQLTSYDGDSIMNYCGGNDLTAKDKEGFLRAYRSLGGGGTVGGGSTGGGEGCHNVARGDSNYCSSSCRCNENEGDCDDDSQCGNGLVCREQGRVDTCVKASGGTTNSCTKPATVRGDGGSGYGECQGDCDRDSDCQGGLVCIQLNGNDKVPGCSGSSYDGNDFCVSPSCL